MPTPSSTLFHCGTHVRLGGMWLLPVQTCRLVQFCSYERMPIQMGSRYAHLIPSPTLIIVRFRCCPSQLCRRKVFGTQEARETGGAGDAHLRRSASKPPFWRVPCACSQQCRPHLPPKREGTVSSHLHSAHTARRAVWGSCHHDPGVSAASCAASSPAQHQPRSTLL